MMRRRETRSQGQVETNARVVAIALGAVLVAFVLFWVSSNDHWFVNARPLQTTLQQIAGLVIATGLLASGWDLVGKRRFAAEVLEKAKLSSDVAQSGIRRITDQYLDEVEWSELFAGAKRLDVVVAYARTWRNSHTDRLKQLVAQPGGSLRVFLPDPNDEKTMRNLAEGFSKTEQQLQEIVTEAIKDFSGSCRGDGQGVEVWVRAGDAVFSCYRFDNRAAVLTLYSHARERRTSVPTLVMAQGQLLRFVSEELDAIQGQSRQVFPVQPEEVDG